jgi:hypothetical protein
MDDIARKLIEMEESVLEAFKARDDAAFTRYFSEDYVGIANDGIKTAADEVAGMHKLDVRELSMEDCNTIFPEKNVAVLSYVMIVKARIGDQEVSGKIFSSSVYVSRAGIWRTVLHTESRDA